MSRIWAGTDCGKTHHHCLVLDSEGDTLLSRRVANDEPELLKLIGDVLDLADGGKTTWALDMTGGEPGLLIALLVNHGQELVYIPGIAVNRATDSYRGQGKTDARDARVIADQARMRRDLQPIRPGDEATLELRLLTDHRVDLVADRTRTTNRLKALLNSMFPALERALDLGNVGPLVLLTGYQTPAAIRRAGSRRLTAWLRNRKVCNAAALAEKVVEAAERQHTAVVGEKAIAKMVHTLAKEVMVLNEKITETDKLIEGRFREHELADVIQSMPGIGTILGAEFLVAVGGSLDAFPTADRLAAFAGVVPAPRDSGQVSGNDHRPTRYHRRLQRVFYISALVSVQRDPNSRKFYDRKRAEGKRHVQAVLALARRRVNVLWALIRDRRCYQVIPSVTTAA
ncbi:IS110 family transposase [Streptomyces sp. NBC_00378]|uniref:IS110 family transposase n=1 Tax=unclassified Streptomyces TaxID=2593676 RepID=UPI00224E72BA|nr:MULTISPECIES: IS110 family transposase [unclassified Streptomyces]MCX5107112.1 IS110 family transposase [Streptomyces sp. NBC_00378]MCX5112222.1 IS110 family transposase [Streptomyces sp. NBC_00378]MCX5112231.1 IS110 family transposase [Streptomyces sp. NBC_00378]MCX5112245.1 IS110 family transposase [Streptomyces sp. NBC_00378]MCX5112292.1 IS110 family transposase [Streptomyces sp. NBC_00378]